MRGDDDDDDDEDTYDADKLPCRRLIVTCPPEYHEGTLDRFQHEPDLSQLDYHLGPYLTVHDHLGSIGLGSSDFIVEVTESSSLLITIFVVRLLLWPFRLRPSRICTAGIELECLRSGFGADGRRGALTARACLAGRPEFGRRRSFVGRARAT